MRDRRNRQRTVQRERHQWNLDAECIKKRDRYSKNDRRIHGNSGICSATQGRWPDRILADFGDVVLAGHPTERGVQFVTWGWDQDRKGVHQGNYFDEDYEAAKQDFAIRSHLIPKDALFDEDQLEEIYYELTLVYDQGEHRPFMRQYELEKTIAQIARLLPEISGQEQTMGQRF